MNGNGKASGLAEEQGHPVTPGSERATVENEDQRLPQTPEPDCATLFISHRHADYRIADMLRDFIQQRAPHAQVYLSSYEGDGPSVGEVLSESLGQQLSAAEVVLLLYTTPDENWSYCMWEVGVAFNPERDDTRVVVLQAGADIPAPLGGRKAVRLSDPADVMQFVGQLFTKAELFPKHGKPLWPGRATDSDLVKAAGRELWNKLQDLGIKPDSEYVWNICTGIVFSLPLPSEEDIKSKQLGLHNMLETEKQELWAELRRSLATNLHIENAPPEAGQLFGLNLRPETTLQDMIDAWRSNRSAEADWVNVLLDQLIRVVADQWPRPKYYGLRHASDERACVPILQKVRRRPAAGLIEYHFVFPRFDFDEESGTICVPMAG